MQAQPPVGTFLLISETSAREIIRHYHNVMTNTLQIIDALSEGTYPEIRAVLPAVKLVQVIHLINEKSIEEVLACADQVNALLLDSGNPHPSVKILGGTGKTHNWQLSKSILR